MDHSLPLEDITPATSSAEIAGSAPCEHSQTDVAVDEVNDSINNHVPQHSEQTSNNSDKILRVENDKKQEEASADLIENDNVLDSKKISDENGKKDGTKKHVQTDPAAMTGNGSSQAKILTENGIINAPTVDGIKTRQVAEDGKDNLDKDDQQKEAKVYKRRWYVLVLYGLFTATQGCVWNSFGPISSSSKLVFGWSDGDIFLLGNWGPIAYIIGGVFFSWMLDVKGLRWACLSSTFLVAAGTVLRCITMETPAATWYDISDSHTRLLIHTGQLLNGLGGPVAMGGPPIVSAVWFPTEERATATAIGCIINYLGVGLSFILGPYLVADLPSVDETPANTTQSPLLQVNNTVFVCNTSSALHNCLNSTFLDVSDVANRRDGIRLYMIIEAAWSAALFLVILIYFPAKPPTPPCTSAGIQRENFLQGLKHLLRRKQFWLVAAIYGVSLGVLNCWATVISIDLRDHNIGEKESGWIGFYSILSSGLLSLIFARFADVFARAMKWFVFSMYVVGSVSFLIFALACIDVVTASKTLFYVTIIVGMTMLNSTVPLVFELACELAYPTGEGTTNIVLTIVNNVFGLLFLFVGDIPDIGTLWMNWTVLGTTSVCLPMLLLLKQRFNRREVDEAYPNTTDINREIILEAGPI